MDETEKMKQAFEAGWAALLQSDFYGDESLPVGALEQAWADFVEEYLEDEEDSN